MIRTARLRLRPLDEGDAGFVLALLNDADFLRHIGDRDVRDEEAALRYIADASLLAVVERATGRTIGMCGLLRRDWLDDPDLGYAFLPGGRGSGYAREAARAVLDGASGPVAAIVNPDNAPSIAVLADLGFALVRPRAHPDGGEVLLYLRPATAPVPA